MNADVGLDSVFCRQHRGVLICCCFNDLHDGECAMSCLQLEDFSISFLSPLCQVDNFFPIFQPFQIKKVKAPTGCDSLVLQWLHITDHHSHLALFQSVIRSKTDCSMNSTNHTLGCCELLNNFVAVTLIMGCLTSKFP